ncbi:MAG: hypothetical protein Q8P26_05505 [Candidatus Levybacteria bacterium]|nr:hypothetical protein [Candidatus Levybacteria bacterium]
MKRNTWLFMLVALIIGGILGWAGAVGVNTKSGLPTVGVGGGPNLISSSSSKAQDLKLSMRKLWEDHITFTHFYVTSAINSLSDSDAILTRLMENQEDLGNAIKPYYGEEAGNKLASLLKDHIALAGEEVEAAMANDDVKFAQVDKEWYDNGNQIADFLSSANPNLSKDDARAMMKDHLDLLKQGIVDALAGRADATVVDYDKTHNQALQMADMISNAIIKQFPNKF